MVNRALVFLLVLVSVAVAQDGDGGEMIGVPLNLDTPTGADEALTTAIQAAANRQPERAARELQVIFDRYPNAFRMQAGGRGAFVGARARAMELLAIPDSELRQAYEGLYAAGAEELLREAIAIGSASGLRDVIRRYEATPAGLNAIIMLADLSLQRGHPAEARLLLSRVPTAHADAFVRVPALRERMARAQALDHAAGGPPPVAQADAATSSPEGAAEPAGLKVRAWPMIGGNATRTRLAGAIRERPDQRSADPDASPSYGVAVRSIHQRLSDVPIQPDRGFGTIRGQQAAREWERAWDDFLPLAPAIARGRLVYADGKQVIARNLYSGEELWRWPEDPVREHSGRTNVSQIFSPSIVDGTVYAAVEVEIPWRPQTLQGVPITYYIPERRMAALDLETGAVRWTHRQPELSAVEERTGREVDPRVGELSIVGAPLVRGDRIYVPAAYFEGMIHVHLMAIDRHTGEVVYVTRISSGQQELNLFGRLLNELATSPIAEADGQIVIGTNLGLVCSIDAVLGTPLWARSYPINKIPSTFLWFEAPRRWPVLDNAPPLIVGDQVLVAPTDGSTIYALSRRSGRVLWEFPAILNRLGFAVRRVHGTDGERLFLGGERGVIALWLEDGEDATGTHRSGQQAWAYDFGVDEQGAGHGVLAEDGLWVPTYRSVVRLDPATGEELAGGFVRAGDDHDERVQLVAGEGALVAVARDFITVRYDKDDVLGIARAAILSDPRAAEPRLAAADISLAVGDFEAAARHYREALERSTRRGASALQRRARSGLHQALLRNAVLQLEQDTDRARAAFDAAFHAAPDEERELAARYRLEESLAQRSSAAEADWRLHNLRQIEERFGTEPLDDSGRTISGWSLRRMAAIHELRGDARRAVADLQTLLERDPASADAAIASEEVRRILGRAGRRIYEPYERRARELFDATLKSGNLDALERGLRIYSNASSAPEATLELARRRLDAGEPERAAALLQLFLVDQPNVPETPAALALLFRSFHERDAFGPAFAALQRLRRSHAGAGLKRPDGATVRALDWTNEWLAREPYATLVRSAHRRDLEPPLVQRFDRSFDGAFVDVPDLLGQKVPELREWVFVGLGKQVAAIDTRTGREQYRLDFADGPRGPLVLAGPNLIAVSRRHVNVFHAVTGKVIARAEIPAGDEGERLLEHSGQVFLLSRARRQQGTMRASAIDPRSGGTRWSRSIPQIEGEERFKDLDVVAQADRLVLFSTGRAHITVLDTSSGAVESRIPIQDEGSAFWHSTPITLPDGTILAAYNSARSSRTRRSQRSYTLLLVDPSRKGPDAIVWRHEPEGSGRDRRLAHVQILGDHVVALESSGSGRASLLRLRDGHLVLSRSLREIVGERFSLADTQPQNDSLLLLLTLGRGDEQPPRLIGIEAPGLTLKYSLELAAAPLTRPASVRSDGVATISLDPTPSNRADPDAQPERLRFHLIDPISARRVQEIVPDIREPNWFTAKVQNGFLLVTFADRVFGYGPK